jgi:hypothetical protein
LLMVKAGIMVIMVLIILVCSYAAHSWAYNLFNIIMRRSKHLYIIRTFYHNTLWPNLTNTITLLGRSRSGRLRMKFSRTATLSRANSIPSMRWKPPWAELKPTVLTCASTCASMQPLPTAFESIALSIFVPTANFRNSARRYFDTQVQTD